MRTLKKKLGDHPRSADHKKSFEYFKIFLKPIVADFITLYYIVATRIFRILLAEVLNLFAKHGL